MLVRNEKIRNGILERETFEVILLLEAREGLVTSQDYGRRVGLLDQHNLPIYAWRILLGDLSVLFWTWICIDF